MSITESHQRLLLAKNIETIKNHVVTYQTSPKKEAQFIDLFPILREPSLFIMLRDILLGHVKGLQTMPTCIVGLESHGFLYAPLIALELQVPFVPVSRKGTLPGPTKSRKFSSEFGPGELEIQEGSINLKDMVLIVDDILGTGGTLKCACDLVIERAGIILETCVVVEYTKLNGRQNVPGNLYAVMTY